MSSRTLNGHLMPDDSMFLTFVFSDMQHAHWLCDLKNMIPYPFKPTDKHKKYSWCILQSMSIEDSCDVTNPTRKIPIPGPIRKRRIAPSYGGPMR